MVAPLSVVRRSFPDPVIETGISRATALAVGRGDLGSTLRLSAPVPNVAFGPQDRAAPGYAAAVAAAHELGFAAVERLAGGRAAVFCEGTIAFAWAVPAADPRAGVRDRFEAVAAIVRDALANLGVDARIGAVPGEYCPGDYSVNHAGHLKVMGCGQRLVDGAAHIGGVVVADGADRIRRVLVPVYRHLGLEWDPATAGSVSEALGRKVEVGEVEAALVDAFAQRFVLADADLPEAVIAAGTAAADLHRPDLPGPE